LIKKQTKIEIHFGSHLIEKIIKFHNVFDHTKRETNIGQNFKHKLSINEETQKKGNN
jgi:hypothetical protein